MASKRGRQIYNSTQWLRLRPVILERDGYRCKIGGPRCVGTADQVDHIVPLIQGGAPYDPDNLRAACKACNVARANARDDNWRFSKTKITLVMGAPGSGKTTYVKERAAPGDLIVDYDTLASAVGATSSSDELHDVVSAARNALLRKVRRGEVGAPRVWLVSSNPEADSLFPSHEIVVLDPGMDECLARCTGEGYPPGVGGQVVAWYRARHGATKVDSESSRVW